jgi:ketosteroid isomerase-like protein
MPEESTTPDLVERVRDLFETASRTDLDAHMRFYARDVVFDVSDAGLGTFEGSAAIRSFLEDWWGTWENYQNEVREVVDLGHGVVFVALWEDGRLVGSDGRVEQQRGWVLRWADGKVVSVTGYLDIDEARAAAERLAASRG